jgi:phosphate starvation-inducible PhoH-like protein
MGRPFRRLRGTNMSKRKSKQSHLREPREHEAPKTNLELRRISPITPNQKRAFQAYGDGLDLFLHGFAGTGKSFIACYLALQDVLDRQYDRVIVVRSAVPSRDVGFLPGNLKEKMQVYKEPYIEILNDLFERGDGFEIAEKRGIFHFTTTSYLRGLTFKDSVVIIEEAQNMSFGEIYTILTRIGDDTKVIINGDFRQTDIQKRDRDNALFHISNIVKKMNRFDFIEFDKSEIVRSKFVKDLIIQTAEYEDTLEHRLF